MLSPDELAGIVDTFGALDRAELERACSETAFRRGETLEDDAVSEAIDDAVESYALIEHDGQFVAGPAAYPELPDGAEDLPHILDVEARSIDRSAVAESAVARVRAEINSAVEASDAERCAELLDRCYEVEAWGPVDLDDERTRLDEVLEDEE